MQDFVIYQIRNKLNNKSYIGKAKNSKYRWSEHKRNVIKKINLPLYNAINKYGLDNFEFLILCNCEHTEKSLNENEIRLIKENNTLSPAGYNLTMGGEGGDTFTNMSTKDKNLKRQRLSITSSGRKRKSIYKYWIDTYGLDKAMQMRTDHINKVKESKKNTVRSADYRLKMSKAIKLSKSKGLSLQHKQRLSEHNVVRFKMDKIKEMFLNKTPITEIAAYFKVSEYTINKKLEIMKLSIPDKTLKYQTYSVAGNCEA